MAPIGKCTFLQLSAQNCVTREDNSVRESASAYRCFTRVPISRKDIVWRPRWSSQSPYQTQAQAAVATSYQDWLHHLFWFWLSETWRSVPYCVKPRDERATTWPANSDTRDVLSSMRCRTARSNGWRHVLAIANRMSPIIMATLTVFTRLVSFRGAHTKLLGLPSRQSLFTRCGGFVYGYSRNSMACMCSECPE